MTSARRRGLLGLLLTLPLALLARPAFAAVTTEPVAARLLRTIQLGGPQGIAVEEVRRLAERGDYTTTLLARSALLVLRQEKPGWSPYDELLDGVLNHLVRQSHAFQPPAGLPDFRGKETVLAMVYAMVMSGQHDRAVDTLERHLATGSKYKHAIVAQALRNIGSPRALGIIQKYAETGENRNLADATLADQDYPVLVELYQRWPLVPPASRMREVLLPLVQGACDERAAMAAYWLGFFAPHPDPAKERAELQALRSMARSRTCKMIDHIIALKSLALRSAESIDRWAAYARQTENVWERHQVVLNAFARWGQRFAPAALRLLATEPEQYVQWELMQGNLVTRSRRAYRTYWDIWLPVTLLVVLDEADAGGPPDMSAEEVNTLLTWLESGARPRDTWVTNHMLFNMAGLVVGDDARRYLRIFDARPKRAERFWILANFREAAALPLLKYWSTLPGPQDQVSQLKLLIGLIEEKASPSAAPCCALDEACLVEQVRKAAGTTPPTIRSEADAREWLSRPVTSASRQDFTIDYADQSGRAAIIRRATGVEERWEFLYDCWHKIDAR